MTQRIKTLAGKLKQNINEIYTLTLITLGLPFIVYLYFGLRASLSVFVVIQIVLGVLRERR
jgi:hypothetical protein